MNEARDIIASEIPNDPEVEFRGGPAAVADEILSALREAGWQLVRADRGNDHPASGEAR